MVTQPIQPAPLPGGRVLHLMYSGDLRGQVERMPLFGTVVRQQRLARAGALLLDAGGWASGTPLSDEFEGAPMIEIMSELGYAAAGIGEPDLAFGLGPLLQRAREARFPLLSANLFDPLRRRLPGVLPFAQLDAGGIRVGVIGLSCAGCERLGQTRVTDAHEAVVESMLTLRAMDAEIFIVLSHLGAEADRALAAALPDIHCIVGAHGDGMDAGAPQRVGNTLISRAVPHAQSLGALSLTLLGTPTLESFERHQPPGTGSLSRGTIP